MTSRMGRRKRTEAKPQWKVLVSIMLRLDVHYQYVLLVQEDSEAGSDQEEEEGDGDRIEVFCEYGASTEVRY